MDIALGFILVALAAAAIGIAGGAEGKAQSIAKDCETLGQFRNGDAVYQCSPKERTK